MSGRGRRQEWQLRDASSPAKPVALDGSSARGLLGLLDGRDDEAAVSAREALAAALATGRMDAIRAAMDAARALLPDAPTWAQRRNAERAEAEAAARDEELGRLARAFGSRPVDLGAEEPAPPEPGPADVLARLDALLSGELSRSQRWNLEQHRRELARVMGNGAKSLPDFARRAAEALDAHGAEVERRRIAAAKRQRTLAGKAPAAGTADAARAVRLAPTDDTNEPPPAGDDDGADAPPDPSPEAA